MAPANCQRRDGHGGQTPCTRDVAGNRQIVQEAVLGGSMQLGSSKGDKGLMRGWPRFLCAGLLFVLVFWAPWQIQKNSHADPYFLAKDTVSYVAFKGWIEPWRSHRSIGYPAFLYLFLAPDPHTFPNALMAARRDGVDVWAGSEKPVYSIAEKTGFASKFETIAQVQRVLLALSIAVFYLALCRWFSPVFSFVALVAAMWLSPPPDPRYILSEPLSCALTWLTGAFLLWAPKCSRHALCFAMACLCASLAFLVRPQVLAMTGLCSLVFLYQIIYQFLRGERAHRLKGVRSTVIAFSPLLLAYGYIGWLSITGGALVLHTHPNMYYSSFCFFADADDAKYMPTARARKFTAYFGEHKQELIYKLENGLEGYPKMHLNEHSSPARRRAILGDSLSYRALREVWQHFKNEKGLSHLTLLQKNILGKELKAGLLHRHAGQMLVSIWQNFIGGLGYYKDVWSLAHFPRATFAINLLSLFLCASAIMACAKVRWALVLLVGIHIMSLLAAALGHFMLGRYVQPTQVFLLLAGIFSLQVLIRRLYSHYQHPASSISRIRSAVD